MPMNPKGMFAVLGRSRHGYIENADRWHVFAIGRETPSRMYQRAVKPPRFTGDQFYGKEAVIARFDTADEAKSWLDMARGHVQAELDAYEAANVACDAARRTQGETRRALTVATMEMVKIVLAP